MLLPTIPAPITTTLACAGTPLTRIPPRSSPPGSQHNEVDGTRKAPAGRILTQLRSRASVRRRPIYRWCTADIREGKLASGLTAARRLHRSGEEGTLHTVVLQSASARSQGERAY